MTRKEKNRKNYLSLHGPQDRVGHKVLPLFDGFWRLQIFTHKSGQGVAVGHKEVAGGHDEQIHIARSQVIAKELFAQADVDGGLIGGASLKATDFIAIISSF